MNKGAILFSDAAGGLGQGDEVVRRYLGVGVGEKNSVTLIRSVAMTMIYEMEEEWGEAFKLDIGCILVATVASGISCPCRKNLHILVMQEAAARLGQLRTRPALGAMVLRWF